MPKLYNGTNLFSEWINFLVKRIKTLEFRLNYIHAANKSDGINQQEIEMAFVDIGAPKRGGRKAGGVNASSLTIVKGGRTGVDLSVQITVSKENMQRMRWLIGDGVSVAFDDENPLLVLLRRIPVGGRTLSSPKGTASTGKANERGILKFMLPVSMPLKHGDSFVCHDAKEDHGGLVLSFV